MDFDRFADLCNQDHAKRAGELLANKMISSSFGDQGQEKHDLEETAKTTLSQQSVFVDQKTGLVEIIETVSVNVEDHTDKDSQAKIVEHVETEAPSSHTAEASEDHQSITPTREEIHDITQMKENEETKMKEAETREENEKKKESQPNEPKSLGDRFKFVNPFFSGAAKSPIKSNPSLVDDKQHDNEHKDEEEDKAGSKPNQTTKDLPVISYPSTSPKPVEREDDNFSDDIDEDELLRTKIMYLVEIQEYEDEGIAKYKNVDVNSDLKEIKLVHAYMEERSVRQNKLQFGRLVLSVSAKVYAKTNDFVYGLKDEDSSAEWNNEYNQHLENGRYDLPIKRVIRKYRDFSSPDELAVFQGIFQSHVKFQKKKAKAKTVQVTLETEETKKANDELAEHLQKMNLLKE